MKSRDAIDPNRAAIHRVQPPQPGAAGDAPSTAAIGPSVAPFFDPQTVVTLDAQGQPLSRFGDTCWDFRIQSRDGESTSNLYFFEAPALPVPVSARPAELAALIREQHKALLWLHVDAGDTRALATIRAANSTLRQFARTAYSKGVGLFDFMAEPIGLAEVVSGMHSRAVVSTRSLIKTLWRHRAFLKSDSDLKLKQLYDAIRGAADKCEDDRQTPILPSRIYCAILGALLDSLHDIEQDLEETLEVYRTERAATLDARGRMSLKQLGRHRGKVLGHLDEFLKKKGYDPKSGDKRKTFLEGLLYRTQLKLMHTVIAFTGMRVGEALILPLKGVMETIEHQGVTHYVINGYTHKLDGGVKRRASWVTSREGHRAIGLAQRIASAILDVVGGDAATDERAFLFCSTRNPYRSKDAKSNYGEAIPLALRPMVTQQDIDELTAMELARPWQRDGIEVGMPWPLTYHQYRRSLAVYAHRSGMVTLPGLKGQLQHVTQEMTSYYSDGFCRAVNLVFDKDHFSHEWRAGMAESSFMAYAMAVLFSDEGMIGGISGRGAGRIANVMANRSKAETLELFRHGKLAYKETALGGCIATDECNHTPLEPIPWDCIETDCPNAIVFGKRLTLLISTQEAVVATLERDENGSVEHRMEADNLRVLLKARQRHAEAS